MARLPTVSGEDAAKVFAAFGYEIVRQPLTIPNHHELKMGLLLRLIRDAGITVEDFIAALR